MSKYTAFVEHKACTCMAKFGTSRLKTDTYGQPVMDLNVNMRNIPKFRIIVNTNYIQHMNKLRRQDGMCVYLQ